MRLFLHKSGLLAIVLLTILSCKTNTAINLQSSQNSTSRKPSGNIFYVSPSGNDRNSGSQDSPWRTIQHAADVLNAGDVVYIREGTYDEKVSTTKDGSQNNYITFAGYENEKIVIQGDTKSTGNGFIIRNSYIKLENLKVTNFESGIWAEGNSGFIEINNCEIYDCSFGIGLQDVHDFIINKDLMHHNGSQDGVGFNFDATPTENGSCYNGKIMNCLSHTQLGRDNCDGFALGHERVHDIEFYDCEAYGVFDGFDVSGKNIKLERCLAHHCFGDGGFKLWQDDITLINCVSYSNSSNVQLDWGNRPVTGRLINCTLYNSEVYNIWSENKANKLEVYNCILSGGKNSGIYFEQPGIENYKGDYNIFGDIENRAITIAAMEDFSLSDIQNGAWIKKTGQDLYSKVEGNPSSLFVTPRHKDADLHLKAGSMAIDNGTNQNAPQDDFDGCKRSGGRIDIGAYEYGECRK